MFFCQSYSARVFKMTNIKTGRNNFTINLQTNKNFNKRNKLTVDDKWPLYWFTILKVIAVVLCLTIQQNLYIINFPRRQKYCYQRILK